MGGMLGRGVAGAARVDLDPGDRADDDDKAVAASLPAPAAAPW